MRKIVKLGQTKPTFGLMRCTENKGDQLLFYLEYSGLNFFSVDENKIYIILFSVEPLKLTSFQLENYFPHCTDESR